VGSGIRPTFELASLHTLCLTSLRPRRPTGNETKFGAKMKTAVAILFFLGIFGLSGEQKSAPTNEEVPPSIGLEVGQPAPSFVLSDQFGHQQSNETLKGSKGTVLLFFRSADW
jgi:hypothetical protein